MNHKNNGVAEENKKSKPLLSDSAAQEIVDKIDYDFQGIKKRLSRVSQLGWVARSIEIDNLIRDFLNKHPDATIVNIGCGFDTTFERVDNGRIKWYDLDLPDVIEIKKKLSGETERRRYIGSSFLEDEWLKKINNDENILFIAAGAEACRQT